MLLYIYPGLSKIRDDGKNLFDIFELGLKKSENFIDEIFYMSVNMKEKNSLLFKQVIKTCLDIKNNLITINSEKLNYFSEFIKDYYKFYFNNLEYDRDNLKIVKDFMLEYKPKFDTIAKGNSNNEFDYPFQLKTSHGFTKIEVAFEVITTQMLSPLVDLYFLFRTWKCKLINSQSKKEKKQRSVLSIFNGGWRHVESIEKYLISKEYYTRHEISQKTDITKENFRCISFKEELNLDKFLYVSKQTRSINKYRIKIFKIPRYISILNGEFITEENLNNIAKDNNTTIEDITLKLKIKSVYMLQ